MHNKFKLLLIIVAVLINLKYAYSADEPNLYCNAVNVCPGITPGNYEIRCRSVSDSFCPENYSKGYWLDPRNCPQLPYGRCAPCDPDCGPCGFIEHYVQPTAEPCGIIENVVVVNNPDRDYEIKAFRSFPNRLTGENDLLGGSTRCLKGQSCTFQYTDSLSEYEIEYNGVAECFGGDIYSYLVRTAPPSSDVLAFGYTKPNLILNVNPSGIVSGTVTINEIATSRLGINKLNAYATKWNPKFNEFRRVCVAPGCSTNDFCSFRLNCGQADPSKCSYFIDFPENPPSPLPQSVERTAVWDTTKCENANFKIYSYTEDPRNSNTREIELTTNNPDAPCTDECPIFTSKTLNAVIAKIKTWLNP